MFKKLFISILLLSSGVCSAELLDKINAVMNDKIITLSVAKRAIGNLPARRDISPQIYSKTTYTEKEMTQLLIQRMLVRTKLEELGYIISDDQVESQIGSTEKRLGVTRADLLKFLAGNKMAFDEYFEVVRETIEFNLFYSRIIQPLVAVTEQEIKNEFYKRNMDNQTLAFRYNLLSFNLHKRHVTKEVLANFKTILENFRNTGVLPQEYSELATTPMGEITEDGLNDQFKELLKNTNEGALSNPILLGDNYHVFLVQTKDLVESELFLRAKDRIYGELVELAAVKAIELWYQREENRHYIRYF